MSNKNLSIQHIEIEDLFGIYTYSIPMDSMDISKLLILYGDNGAGKTTILEMIFNLLSSEESKGYKTALANTKFKKIAVTLSNNTIISAYREDNLIGDYKLLLEENNIEIFNIYTSTVIEHNEYKVRKDNDGYGLVYDFLKRIKELNLSIHYLSDDRKVKSNIQMILDEKNDELSVLDYDMMLNKNTITLSNIFLRRAIKRVEEWFQTQASLANAMGQNEIQDIYFTLISELLLENSEIEIAREVILDKNKIISNLKTLDIRNKDFMKYELSVDYDLDKYSDIIQKAPQEKLQTITNILNPYIEGIETKLNAIEETKNIIDTFILTLNDFYTGKKLSFSIDNGLKITSLYNKEEDLTVSMLSSGEKQLLLLFCNTITAREQASIFIIDEPELSLNVKWQRKLIDALLSFSEGSSIQFILASHSIELLTKYKNNVCKLTNVKDS